MELFLFAQARVEQRAAGQWQRPAVCAVKQPAPVQDLQVLADGHLRGAKSLAELLHQHAAVLVHHLDDGATPLLVEDALDLGLNGVHRSPGLWVFLSPFLLLCILSQIKCIFP